MAFRRDTADLEFDNDPHDPGDTGKIRDDLSAVAQTGENLWLGTDEGVCLERLSALDQGVYGNHKRFDLRGFLALPDGDQSEVDVEGLDVSGGYVWLVGSHSLKRKNPKPEKNTAENLERLADVSRDPNRYLLARIPVLLDDDSGEYELAASGPHPSNPSKTLRAAQLPVIEKRNALSDALREDPHLGPFAKIASKDNGLDIEGLAVSKSRIFVGLRGPVLRGWAVVLELDTEHRGEGALELKRIGPDGRPYRKHFLSLQGLGVRDLAVDGADLLILAGPTMDLDGPVAVFRWPNGANPAGAREDSMVWAKDLEKILDVPYGDRADHAEGMTVLRTSHGGMSLLIVYDSPGKQRRKGVDGVTADVFHAGVGG
jgi:hypothetical protein